MNQVLKWQVETPPHVKNLRCPECESRREGESPLADENLGRRPAKFITDPNMARLDKVRSAYDPDGRFHSWMGRG